MLEMRMTVVVVPAIYSYAIFGDKNYSSAQIIHIIPFAIQVSKYISCINEFSSYLTLSPWITIWMKFCPGNMIITSKFDETGTFCSIWTKCDSSLIFSLFVMSFASGADHQASSAIVSKQAWNEFHTK